MNKPTYTPQELQGKFITCFVLLSGKRPYLDCVRRTEEPHKGEAYLYNTEEMAKSDKYFDADNDDVIPATEYFIRVNPNKAEALKQKKAIL